MRRKVPPTWYPKLALQLLKICDTAENISSACRLEGKSILLIHGGTKGAKMVQAVLDTLFGCPQLLVLNVNLSTSEGRNVIDKWQQMVIIDRLNRSSKSLATPLALSF